MKVSNNFENHVINELNNISAATEKAKLYVECGKVINIVGLAIEVSGLSLPLGQACRIFLDTNIYVDAEVIGFSKDSIMIMPYDYTHGIAKGMMVIALPMSGVAPVGDQLLGRIVNALGAPIDDLGMMHLETTYPLYPKPLNPLKRARISESLDVGVRVINAMLTTCKGQRMGIFAESGIGKSVLLGMMTKFTDADVVVVGLIGERGREVKEFIEEILGSEGLKKSIIVAAAADNSPLMKVRGATYATTIAEYFRDLGKNVLLIVDSLTRYAQAYREMALSSGELPTSKGYTPTVFAKLSQLIERSGKGLSENGSITVFYTILIEGEELSDPIAEHVRSLIDGHIVLSRALAESGHFPAVDVEKSISRLMHSIVSTEHHKAALLLKKLISAYQNSKEMIQIGMYQQGSDHYIDYAMHNWRDISSFLTQGMNESTDMKNSVDALLNLTEKAQVVV